MHDEQEKNPPEFPIRSNIREMGKDELLLADYLLKNRNPGKDPAFRNPPSRLLLLILSEMKQRFSADETRDNKLRAESLQQIEEK